MSLIGIISSKKDNEFIKKEIKKYSNKTINIIHINYKSIENLSNIKFDVIIIDKSINQFNMEVMEKILSNIKYLIINSDIDIRSGIFNKMETNIIDYGLNQKATVTASSINEENIIICLQRNIKNINNKIIETDENKINIESYKNKRIYNYLIIYILNNLYK